MPLDALKRRMQQPHYPPYGEEVMPLIQAVQFKDVLLPAIQQIFGKTMLVRSAQQGTVISKRHNVDTVTLRGDQVNKRGALTGGFVKHKAARLALASQVAVCFLE